MTLDPRLPTPPRRAVPAGSCDTHAHVYAEPYPVDNASYVIPRAHPDVYRGMLATTGMTYGVVVQPDAYRDTRLLEQVLAEGVGRLAGVAVVDERVTPEHLERLHTLGVRGLRFNLQTDRRTGQRYAGSAGADALRQLAPRLGELGWHAQLWGPLDECLRLAADTERHAVPVVLDHMGWPDVAAGTGGAGFQRLLRTLDQGNLWVKLSVCRFGAPEGGYPGIRPFHDALVGARPDRLLWGSDWPYVGMGDAAPDVGELLDLFQDWVADDKTVAQILVANPARLYGLPEC
ncbi:amidohydrolase family protein [Plantactinospora solaniradicis]|uniref:Amidohydrolase family protein n=1 Tax=Plantactinospora solaniradicis TaxID=1723736 RepID=A0ABW1KFY9_9ACTN